ncbi:MAG: ADOP family duplicated permease, partial [Blastocatellia bacterium]
MLTWLKDLLRKARFLLLRDRVERDIDRELDFHIDLRTRENLESGMAWRAARKDAVRRFGNMAYIKENCRDERGSGFVEVLLQDLRIGARMLGKSPVFSLVIVVTLAVGIGANSLIFSVVNAVLINGLPYKDSDRLVQFWEKSPIKHWDYNVCSPANYLDWKSQNQSFQDMAAYIGSNDRGPGVQKIALTRGGASEIVHGLSVTGELFSVLGANAMLGRTFTAEETWKGKTSVAVLGYNLWKSRFGGDAGILGQQIQLDGLSYTVIGVMPAPFYFPSREVELWVPMGWSQNIVSVRRPHFLRVIGRLKDGVPLEKARADVVGIAANLEKQYPDTNTKMGVGLGPFKEWIVEETRPALLIFLAAVAFVLLIACANIANLLLSRSASRAKEMAVRAALGAGKFRLTRQLLTECLMLATAGGGLGLILAVAGRRLLVAFNPGNIPRFDDVSLDWRVIAFTVGISVISVLLFGLVPALAVSRPDLVAVLKEGGRSGGLGAQGTRARKVMVVAEVALSTLLVISAGLMIRSFARLQRVAPGFVASDLLTFKLSLPAKYKTDPQVNGFFDDVMRRMNALPGVQSAAAITSLPLTGTTWTGDFTIEGRPAGEYGVEVRHESVTPDYFKTMETPLVSGRWFTDADNDPKNQVIIINQALATRYFQNDD